MRSRLQDGFIENQFRETNVKDYQFFQPQPEFVEKAVRVATKCQYILHAMNLSTIKPFFFLDRTFTITLRGDCGSILMLRKDDQTVTKVRNNERTLSPP
jgi:hypothetical protein